MSNEKSSSYGNTTYKGLEVNHQYSKGLAFENMFRDYVHEHITTDIAYFSLIRPWYEIKIAEFTKMQDLHYKIKQHGLLLQNMMVLMLYTDFSILSAKFTATFREKYDKEPLESIKSRNREFYWFSS